MTFTPRLSPLAASDQRALADEWGTLRELLAAERAAIAALESRLAAGTFVQPSPAGIDADRIAAEATQLTVLMEELVRREAELETARHELAQAQKAAKAGPAAACPRSWRPRPIVWPICVPRSITRRPIWPPLATSWPTTKQSSPGSNSNWSPARGGAASRAGGKGIARGSSGPRAPAVRSRAPQARCRTRSPGGRRGSRAYRVRAHRARQSATRAADRTLSNNSAKLLETERAKLAKDRTDLKLAQESARACQAEFTRAHERLEADRQQVSLERDRLVALEIDTKNQRRRIAREFRVQHATHLADLESRRAELESLVSATEAELRSLAAATEAGAKR